MNALATAAAVSLSLLAATAARADGSLRLVSPAIANEGDIPARYTCQGPGTSPPLAWSGVPEGTQSLAIVMVDPDAPRGTFTHWLVYDLPPSTTVLPAGAASSGALPQGTKQGMNDDDRVGYGPPCPPSPWPHHYIVELYALDAPVPARDGLTRAELERAVEGHVLARTQLIGIFQKAL